jgi:hypothetical protein
MNNSYARGSSGSLECSAMGGPNNEYQWMVNGSIITGETSQNLTRSNISADDGGMYTCFASNLAGNDSASTFVFVLPYIVSDPDSQSVSTGSTAVLECDAEAFPQPEYLWLRADERNIRSQVSDNGKYLNISSVEYGDEGGYYCNASVGEVSVSSGVAVITG